MGPCHAPSVTGDYTTHNPPVCVPTGSDAPVLSYRKFSSKLTLRRHMGVHGGAKPFSCPHCCYSSRLKASLLQHLRTHTGTHTCRHRCSTRCGCVLTGPLSTGEKPYRCPDCAYASIDRSSLLRHYRTHSQEKPYRCQHCSYRR